MFIVIAILTHHHCKYQQLILSQQFLNFTNIYISILKYFLCNAPLQKLSIFQSFCISVHKLYVQVTESMTSEDVRKRELTPLQKRNQRFSLVPQNYRIFFMNWILRFLIRIRQFRCLVGCDACINDLLNITVHDFI